jgi:hypothetical protein
VSRHQGVGLAAILEAAFFVSAAVCVLVIEARRASAPALGLRFAYVAALFVGTFSWLYSLDGSSSNFTHALSHLDAFYFALGTLSTAGTGNLSAISESARLIQSVEMATGMGLVLFGVAAVVARLAKA